MLSYKMRFISKNTDTHAVHTKERKKKKKQLKSRAFNRFASKQVCVEKGHG